MPHDANGILAPTIAFLSKFSVSRYIMIRTYPEIQQVMRRIEAIVHDYIPDAEVKIFDSNQLYAYTFPPSEGKKVIIRFSRMLVESGTWEQIEETVAHEIAHVLQADKYDTSAVDSGWHTEEWGDISQALGGSGKTSYYPDVLFPPRYKYRCADCGYMTNVYERRYKSPISHGEISVLLPGVTEHVTATGHHKWYVLDELTGRRWTKTH
jgi:hypothetical protein